MSQQIKLRRDTASNWTAANPVLGQAEIGFENDNLGLFTGSGPAWLNNGAARFKIGDGSTPWNTLPYSVVVTDGTYAGATTSPTPAVISFGSGAPSASHGAVGDIYFNTAGAAGTTIYQKRTVGAAWSSVA